MAVSTIELATSPPNTSTWRPEPRRASDTLLSSTTSTTASTTSKPFYNTTTSATNLIIANTELYTLTHGLDQVPRQYRQLISHTESFVETIQFLAKLPGNFDCVAGLLIDFASGILKAKNSCWKHMLNSQRGHIFWMLDDALLALCVDEWEKPGNSEVLLEKKDIETATLAEAPLPLSPPLTPATELEDLSTTLSALSVSAPSTPIPTQTQTPWPTLIQPVLARLNLGISAIPSSVGAEWVSEHERVLGWDWWKIIATEPQISRNMMECYFSRTKKFLADSEAVYWIKKRAYAGMDKDLPRNLADIVIDGVLEREGLPSRRLRSVYFPVRERRGDVVRA